MAHVLVVDDEPKLGKLVSEALALDGHAVTRAGGGRAALAELQKEAFEIVVADLRMPDVDGLAVLQAARARIPPAEVILMTAHATAESAVAAMKAGAADYLIKPFAFEELRLRVQRLADQRAAPQGGPAGGEVDARTGGGERGDEGGAGRGPAGGRDRRQRA